MNVPRNAPDHESKGSGAQNAQHDEYRDYDQDNFDRAAA
jgi:hypothetical protein